ncbi:MAG: hypothetical protein FD124_3384, partial [Alphaproteobacteria bacterium]
MGSLRAGARGGWVKSASRSGGR